MKNFLVIGSVIVGLVVVAFIVLVFLAFQPNTRSFQGIGFSALGRIKLGGAQYYTIDLTPPFDFNSLDIRYDRAVVVSEGIINENTLQAVNADIREDESSASIEYRLGKLRIHAVDLSVVEISLIDDNDYWGPTVEVKTSISSKWISFPFDDESIESLFGRPKLTFDFFMH